MEHFPCVLARSSRSFFGFAYVAKVTVRMAGMKGTKPIRTLDPRSSLPDGMQTSPFVD